MRHRPLNSGTAGNNPKAAAWHATKLSRCFSTFGGRSRSRTESPVRCGVVTVQSTVNGCVFTSPYT
jgi:hypothetical protein